MASIKAEEADSDAKAPVKTEAQTMAATTPFLKSFNNLLTPFEAAVEKAGTGNNYICTSIKNRL